MISQALRVSIFGVYVGDSTGFSNVKTTSEYILTVRVDKRGGSHYPE
jgi:hypothetical protein